MFWRAFRRRTAPTPEQATWWADADAAAADPDVETITRLRTAAPPGDEDETERQAEMIEGLEELAAIATAELPVLVTQHRVIGTDTCHFVAPASLVDGDAVPGKLFLTSSRLVFAGPRVVTWPWHRVRRVERAQRMVLVSAGGEEVARWQCNTYGEAMTTAYLARRLMRTR
ncbi:MAG: hypothetical protein R2752_10870 [Vicinamibacterales bacterium]